MAAIIQNETVYGGVPKNVLNDNIVSNKTTYSSTKIEDKLDDINDSISSLNDSLTNREVTISNATVSGGCINKNVSFSATASVTASANTWVTIGTVNLKPTSEAYVPVVKTADGAYAGMINIQTWGTVRFYAKENFSNNPIGFTANYRTDD